MNYLPGLASNHDPPDFCLLSSWDYRCEPLAPGLALNSWSSCLSLPSAGISDHLTQLLPHSSKDPHV
jgi:hypothetical protein